MVDPVEEIHLPSLSPSAPIVDGARATTDFRLYLEKTKEALESYLGAINETVQQIVDILDGTQPFEALNIGGDTITAIGSMAEQNADDVAITGGEMSGVALAANDATFTGRTTLGDAEFYAELGSDTPTINAALLSYLTYDRVANTWVLNAGNVGSIILDPSGEGVVLNTPGALLRFSTGADTFIYYSATETLSFVADNVEQLKLESSGAMVRNPTLTDRTSFDDPLFYAEMDGPDSPTLSFDADDFLSYNRLLDGFVFSVGGVAVANITEDGVNALAGLSATLDTYADNAAAIAGGLVATQVYQTATGEVRIVV